MLKSVFSACFLLAAIVLGEQKPNLIIILADDFGWGNIGFHRTDGSKEVQTPNLDALAASGVILDRFYTYKICSPTRCSLQTGRLPVHVNTLNLAPVTYNPENPISGYAGVPRNMTGIAQRLKEQGYSTVMTGKWDVGMATPRHTPKGRGYDKFLGYFHHANDYNTCGIPITAVGEIDTCLNRFVDLWLDDGPAKDLAGSAYEEDLFEKHTIDAINSHDVSRPLFLFHSFHFVHTPLQIPAKNLAPFSFIDYLPRRKYAAMVYYMDRIIGNIVTALKNKNLYENSLILFFSDNGGPVYNPGSASNYPLRAGKYADFEGGVRVNAFAFGGRIPSERRGSISSDLVHVSDIYGSFLKLAKYGTNDISSTDYQKLIDDHDAIEAGLPNVDSVDTFWRAITGKGGVKRSEIHLSSQALISGKYKIIVGDQKMDMWQGPQYPNSTGAQPFFLDFGKFHYNCGSAGCLFDIFADPTEHTDLADKLPQIRKELLDRLTELNKSEFQPKRGGQSLGACKVALKRYNGFYGPFVDLEKEKMEVKDVRFA